MAHLFKNLASARTPARCHQQALSLVGWIEVKAVRCPPPGNAFDVAIGKIGITLLSAVPKREGFSIARPGQPSTILQFRARVARRALSLATRLLREHDFL